MKFTCSTCGEQHDLSELSFGATSPLQWDLLSESEREGSELTPDRCIIRTENKTYYFVRACLEVPVTGTDQCFCWGVWVSLSERSFTEMEENWENPQREQMGPYFGWLCTKIPDYPDTMYLKTSVHQRELGVRPSVQLERSEHPLSLHQEAGIPFQEMQSRVIRLLHGQE
jgi:hypothetical protein